ncbi:unnamed protein product [Moneuplotes crassus]|uniref:Uncharacterized protein n=1 Tax=Euplotes crassus TaxID=5936 RepID=A0AAD1XQ07_EUPCR|nr:unnamed protein product [Moneuplotes crassus]
MRNFCALINLLVLLTSLGFMITCYQASLKKGNYADVKRVYIIKGLKEHPDWGHEGPCFFNIPLCVVKYSPEIANYTAYLFDRNFPKQYVKRIRETFLPHPHPDEGGSASWYFQAETIISIIFMFFFIGWFIDYVLKVLFGMLFQILFTIVVLAVIFILFRQQCYGNHYEHTIGACGAFKSFFGNPSA